MSLESTLLTEPNRTQLVADCEALVRSEVAVKSGLSGIAIKGAFGLVQRLRPNFLNEAINMLLNDFVHQLEPFYTRFIESPDDRFGIYINQRSPTVASALLEAADFHVDKADNVGIQKAYKKLRPTGKKHVESALPELAVILEKYLS